MLMSISKRHLSRKPIPLSERLILALDVPSAERAKELVEALGETVHFYKLGLELFMAGGYFELIDWLRERGHKIFVDLKFFDIPETVRSAVRQLKKHGATFATVHGNDPMLKAAVDAARENGGGLKILAVTVLTSLDRNDLRDLGFQCDPKPLVLSRARRALSLGCDGVVSSGLEAAALRNELGEQFLIIMPGIRPVENIEVIAVDDQKRTVDVEEAFLNGADYVVVGRPIRNAKDPKTAAESIQHRIAALFSSVS